VDLVFQRKGYPKAAKDLDHPHLSLDSEIDQRRVKGVKYNGYHNRIDPLLVMKPINGKFDYFNICHLLLPFLGSKAGLFIKFIQRDIILIRVLILDISSVDLLDDLVNNHLLSFFQLSVLLLGVVYHLKLCLSFHPALGLLSLDVLDLFYKIVVL
jgi:hypothetical protein